MEHYSKEQIEAFLHGMDVAAKINAQTPRGCQEALKVRREARTLQLLNEERLKNENRIN